MDKRKSMKKQFVTYEIALKLKELGFDEECLARYEGINWLGSIKEWTGHKLEITFTPSQDTFSWQLASAPLWQQVIDWFREKHQLHIELQTGDFKYYGVLYKSNENKHIGHDIWSTLDEIDYNDAREQAILKAIELCQKTTKKQ